MATSRRSFLIATGKLIVLLPAGYAFASTVGCGSSNSGGGEGSCGIAGRVIDNGTTLVVTSECVGSHTHDFTIQDADLGTPPASGVSGETSTTESHTHTVTLTEADLAAIEAGTTVTKASGTTEGHTHNFAFTKTPS
jgi:hypothetical protein